MEPNPQENQTFRSEEIKWLSDHSEELSRNLPGNWIGIDAQGLIAHAPSIKELMHLCSAENRDPLVTYVPEPNTPTRFYGIAR